MILSEPAVIISLMAVSAPLIGAALILAVRWRKNKKWKPSNTERRLRCSLSEHTVHTDEAATLTKEELDMESRDTLKDSVQHYDDPKEPVAEDDWEVLSEAEDVRRLKGMAKSERIVSVEEMDGAIRDKAGN